MREGEQDSGPQATICSLSMYPQRCGEGEWDRPDPWRHGLTARRDSKASIMRKDWKFGVC